jgi:hypothetical protein
MTGPDRCIVVGGPCRWGLTLLNPLLPLAHNLLSASDICVSAAEAYGVGTP